MPWHPPRLRRGGSGSGWLAVVGLLPRGPFGTRGNHHRDAPSRRSVPASPPGALLRHPPSASFRARASLGPSRASPLVPSLSLSDDAAVCALLLVPRRPFAAVWLGTVLQGRPSPLRPPKSCPPLLLPLPWRHHVWPQPCCEAVRAGVFSLPGGGVARGWHGGWTARGAPWGSVWRRGAAALVSQLQQCSSGFPLLTFPSPFFVVSPGT